METNQSPSNGKKWAFALIIVLLVAAIPISSDIFYRKGTAAGYADGQANGEKIGYTAGYESGHGEGFKGGQSDGYLTGYSAGVDDGYTSGYSAGADEGYTLGYSVGTDDGYTEGYEAGAAYYFTARTSGVYCATRSGECYHTPYCRYASSATIWFLSASEAKYYGFRPCSKCKP